MENGKKGDRTLCLIFSREWGRSQFWRMKMCRGAIACSECFPNKLPCIFSRENLKVVKQDYLP
ncbi:hypothetical protein [Cylindrospermopsis raciborskii]|uniref:hypothetical protein n=1 Tax=Cylindrospermopsis raciborskii TaxID=77022 RepID=UPI00128FCABE|nr:hypothetical protein [Cylindrospermopsis raciborskii]